MAKTKTQTEPQVLTITEALAEIKTIGKRIEKKEQFVQQFLHRTDNLKDPLARDGKSSQAAIKAERQAIADLNTRVVAIRASIAKTNAETELTVGGVTRSIANWIIWRREVAPREQAFNERLRSTLAAVRQSAQRAATAVRMPDQPAQSEKDVIVNIDEHELAEQIEQTEAILGTLDGALSLKNATTTIDL